jgi:hypothetical protein
MRTLYAWARRDLFKLDAQVVGEHIESLVEHFNEHLTADEILARHRSTARSSGMTAPPLRSTDASRRATW